MALKRRNAYDEINFDTTVKGYAELKKELKAFDPELRRAMDKEIRENVQPVATLAKSYVPTTVMTGWRKAQNPRGKKGWGDRIGWDQSEVKKGIGVKQGGKRSRGRATSTAWKISNVAGGGVIYELAGSKTKGEGKSGQQFVQNISNVGGAKTSRLIWRAWDESKAEHTLTRDVQAIVKKYEQILENALNK